MSGSVTSRIEYPELCAGTELRNLKTEEGRRGRAYLIPLNQEEEDEVGTDSGPVQSVSLNSIDRGRGWMN